MSDVLRCKYSTNPCGTDTWEADHECNCLYCQTWLRIKALENPWVSVDERLPEKRTDCLVYIADRKSVMLTVYLDDFALARVSPTEGFTEHGVTHWQPVFIPESTND